MGCTLVVYSTQMCHSIAWLRRCLVSSVQSLEILWQVCFKVCTCTGQLLVVVFALTLTGDLPTYILLSLIIICMIALGTRAIAGDDFALLLLLVRSC